jgi:predicted flap endonuclease-1-like 5' DNA nuclease
MSALMSWLACHWFPLLLGALAGWLLNKWLCKCTSKTVHTHAQPVAAAAPVARAADPVVSAPLAPVVSAPKVEAVAAIDLKAARAAGFTIKHADDLTVVEGIGPKINELFNNAGVRTFVQLAAQTVPQMQKVLDGGGSRFRIANPATWAQQSALAAANKWAELKKLQDELSGGLRK